MQRVFAGIDSFSFGIRRDEKVITKVIIKFRNACAFGGNQIGINRESS